MAFLDRFRKTQEAGMGHTRMINLFKIDGETVLQIISNPLVGV